MESTIEVDRAICAMFLFSGFNNYGPKTKEQTENLQAAIDGAGGVIGIADYLAQFSFTLANCLAAGLEKHGDAPGVFDYEVTEIVGEDIKDYVLANGDLPSVGVVRSTMIEPRNAAFWDR